MLNFIERCPTMAKIKKSIRIEESLSKKVEEEFEKFSEGSIKIIEKYYEPSEISPGKYLTENHSEKILEMNKTCSSPAQLNISAHQEMILREMFPGKTTEQLLEAMVDHLIPDVDKKGIAWLDDDGKIKKEYESKYPLDDSCPKWKKNLRAMQAVDRMMEKKGIPQPPAPNIKYVPVKSRL